MERLALPTMARAHVYPYSRFIFVTVSFVTYVQSNQVNWGITPLTLWMFALGMLSACFTNLCDRLYVYQSPRYAWLSSSYSRIIFVACFAPEYCCSQPHTNAPHKHLISEVSFIQWLTAYLFSLNRHKLETTGLRTLVITSDDTILIIYRPVKSCLLTCSI